MLFCLLDAAVRSSYLRAGENDGFAQMFAHEGQSGGCVGHSVRAMKDHETIVVFVVFLELNTKKDHLSLDDDSSKIMIYLYFF